MDNPYLRHAANLENSASKIIEITPDDVLPLDQVCKALRIFNPNAAAATIVIVTTGGSEVTLTIPASCLWTEPAIVTHVKATGTTAELILHGYTD